MTGMQYSKLFGKTTKDVPRSAVAASHRLLYQAGYIRSLAAGRYAFLPLGMRVRDRIMKIIEEEMDKAGAQKMIVPVLHPLELWQETHRTESAGFELMKVRDRHGADFALGGTAEEAFVEIIRNFNLSYKDLPFNVYQFSTKFRDELRARGGLLRVREFVMKDAYSFHADEKDFVKEYDKMAQTYFQIFKRLGLKTIKVEADNGYIGGDYCHEFVVESEVGESRFFTAGDYAAHEEVCKFKRDKKNLSDQEKKLATVEANRGPTMADGVGLHKLPLWQQIKDLMMVDDKGNFVLAVIRGDLDVNEVKLKNLAGVNALRHATKNEIIKLGSYPGFISPIGLSKKVKVIVDSSLKTIKNAYTGANKKHKDFINANYGRDFASDIEGDIATAKAGFIAENGKKLVEKQGIEVGNIFQLGYHYSKKMKGAVFTDQDGKEKPFYMGCYGIGLGRTMAAVVELCHDDRGICWPKNIAPFDVHLIAIKSGIDKVRKLAEKTYQELLKAGVEVLYDDRQDTAGGEKLVEADLIGISVRLVISGQTNGKIEWKKRSEKKAELLTLNQVLERLT